MLDNVYFTLNKGDKVAFIGRNDIAMTTLFKILMGEMEPDSGSFKWVLQPLNLTSQEITLSTLRTVITTC